MKTILNIFAVLFTINFSSVKGQDSLYQQSRWTTFSCCHRDVFSYDSLPFPVRSVIDSLPYLSHLRQNITFEAATIIDVFSLVSKSRPRWQVPAYSVHFNLRMIDKGIARYHIVLELDQFGQVINLNLPHKIHYENISQQVLSFVSLNEAKQIANEFIQSKEKKYDVPDLDLVYEECHDDIYWTFSYLIDSHSLTRRYLAVQVSVHDKSVISHEYYEFGPQ